MTGNVTEHVPKKSFKLSLCALRYQTGGVHNDVVCYFFLHPNPAMSIVSEGSCVHDLE